MQARWLNTSTVVLLATFFLVVLCITTLMYSHQSKLSNDSHSVKNSFGPEKANFAIQPGEVANVFGWGYNRTSCYINELKDSIVFFYAEDQNIYYTYHSQPEEYYAIEGLPVPQNPDFDVLCTDSSIYLTISDVNQQYVYFLEGKLLNKKYEILSSELVYDGQVAYNAVAPHTRIFNGNPYIAFMEYGRAGTYTPNSKVFVSKRLSPNQWKTEKLFEYPAITNQVLGISLEEYQNTLYAFIHPDGGGMFITKLAQTGEWVEPKKQDILNNAGHLEWQTLVDEHGTLHLVFATEKNTISYAQLHDDNWKVWELNESLAINTRNLFEIPSRGVFLIYNTGLLRQVLSTGLSQKVQVQQLNDSGKSLYFLRVPELVDEKIDLVWLEGEDGKHTITYKSFNINAHPSELQSKDSSIFTASEKLVTSY